MYEIETKGFIVQPREGDGIELGVNIDYCIDNKTIFGPRVHTTDSESNAISLQNATVLTQILLTASSHDTDSRDTVDQRERGVTVFSKMGQNVADARRT